MSSDLDFLFFCVSLLEEDFPLIWPKLRIDYERPASRKFGSLVTFVSLALLIGDFEDGRSVFI